MFSPSLRKSTINQTLTGHLVYFFASKWKIENGAVAAAGASFSRFGGNWESDYLAHFSQLSFFWEALLHDFFVNSEDLGSEVAP